MTTTPDNGPDSGSRQPSLVPGMSLLVIAGALIVVVLVNPDMPRWLRTVIAVLAILIVVLLLIFAFRLFRVGTGRGGRK